MKKISLLLVLFASLAVLSACGNKDVWGSHYDFKYAQVKMLDGEIIQGTVKQWAHDDDNDNIRVTFEDGAEYYTSSENVVLYNK